jgi:tetratricopeptide (TPR) repeat protein
MCALVRASSVRAREQKLRRASRVVSVPWRTMADVDSGAGDAWRRLPFQVLRVLRAGAMLGPSFDLSGVSALLRCEPGRVLERLQQAADRGVRIVDDGEDRFTLPAALRAALMGATLPSLARVWGRPAEAATSEGQSFAALAAELTSVLDEAAVYAMENVPRPESSTPPPPPPSASMRLRKGPRALPRPAEGAEEEQLALDFLTVAREAADRGEPEVAAGTLQRALDLLGSHPKTPTHQRLRILGQIELGRLQWQAAGPELGFTLSQALATLDAARQEFGADAPSDVVAELCQVIAGVCFDIGDMASLERALEELAVASRLLQSEGETARAARLLNEQAAVLMRMGDALRAKELLRESRKVFQSLDQDDPVTLRELAETDHLTAWLPLYAAMVPGREQDGYRMALERAAAAERVYRRLDDVRELARVWETMGRLERLQRRHDEALRHLEAAAAAQTRLGDLTGLGRTTEAMSDVLNQCGREAEAIALLRESIRFNQEKGSLIGLFFNRRAFTEMVVRLGTLPDHAEALQEVAVLLVTAERALVK